MNEGEKKSVVMEVASWVWGTVEGGFNEQQTTSQIIVDAVIGMIPVVGDVTAVRDLIAVVLRLVRYPEKRKEVLEWVVLVLLLFALIPVVGGVVKGVGKLLVKEAASVGRHAELLRDIIKFLNRIGEGNAVKFLEELSVEKYAPELMGHFRGLMRRLDLSLEAISTRMKAVLPERMKQVLETLRKDLAVVRDLGEKMIPEAIKDLHMRLKSIQHLLYEGEWERIGNAVSGKGKQAYEAITRETEARLVSTTDSTGKVTTTWEVKNPPFPSNGFKDFDPVVGWPDLGTGNFVKKGDYWAIAAFNGPMRAVTLPPGTKIYRTLNKGSRSEGLWWLYHLPDDGVAWRKEFAVLDSFGTGAPDFVEMTVGPAGLHVWEGKVANQLEKNVSAATSGQYLVGGETQLLIDFTHPANAYAAADAKSLARQPLPWNVSAMTGVDVPLPGVTLQSLGTHEIEPKLMENAAHGAGVAQRGARAAESTPRQSEEVAQ
jgi:hypothetical protein